MVYGGLYSERGESAMVSWLCPPIVYAPSAKNRNDLVRYSISEEFFEKNAYIKRKTPIFQIWVHVVGKLPPINNIDSINPIPTLLTLNDSVACFKGINRPCDGENNGDSILIYVLNPMVSILYEANMVCVAKAIRLGNVVATVQVRLQDSLQDSGETVSGRVTRIEFVAGNGDSPNLPQNADERYNERLW